jgi:hypothetical protein
LTAVASPELVEHLKNGLHYPPIKLAVVSQLLGVSEKAARTTCSDYETEIHMYVPRMVLLPPPILSQSASSLNLHRLIEILETAVQVYHERKEPRRRVIRWRYWQDTIIPSELYISQQDLERLRPEDRESLIQRRQEEYWEEVEQLRGELDCLLGGSSPAHLRPSPGLAPYMYDGLMNPPGLFERAPEEVGVSQGQASTICTKYRADVEQRLRA